MIQFSSVAQSGPTLCNPMDCSTPGLLVHHQLRVCSNSCPFIQWCHPTISSSVVPFSSHLQLSQHQGVSQWVSSMHQVAKVLQFQLQHQSFQWIFGLISFRMDWLDLLTVQGTLKSLLQHHSSEASVLWCSALSITSSALSLVLVQLAHPYRTTGKTIALTVWIFVSKMMFVFYYAV